MTTPRYLPVATFKLWARDEIAVDDDLIESAINAAEELLDVQSHRQLVPVDADTVATARRFVPSTSRILYIPDAASITDIVENGVTLIPDVNYQLEPYGNTHPTTGAYRPYDRLVRLGGYRWYGYDYTPTVTVTAKWGWSEIPALAVEACKVLAADWLEHRNIRLGVVGSTVDGFSIGVRSSPAVQAAIKALAPDPLLVF